MALTTTTTTPSGWANDAAFGNFQLAQQAAQRPFAQYQGNMLAPWDVGQQAGYNSIMNGQSVGLQAQQQAQGAALNAAQFGPMMTSAPSYQAAMQGVYNTGAAGAGPASTGNAVRTDWASAGPAAQGAAVGTGWANAGPASLGSAFGTTAANAGPASLGNAIGTQFASAGPAQQMQGAQMGRGEVANVQAGSFPGANLSQYMNPYISNVVDTTLGQLGRQNDIIQNKTNARAAAAGAFGGGRQAVANSENNRAFLDTAASTTANLYNQGFNTAQQAIGLDQNRALQAGQSNQQADLAVGQSNLANRQQSAMQNMLAGNNMAQFNAGNQQRSYEASAAAANAMAGKNMDALNSQSQYNAGLAQRGIEATSAAQNRAAEQNMLAQNSQSQYQAGLAQRGIEATSLAQNDMAARNMAALNSQSQYNAGLTQS